jgi:hypothetical protein
VADAWEAPAATRPGLSAEEAGRIASARVYLAFWGSSDPEKEVRLNGVPVGRTPVSDWFSCHSCVEVPAGALAAIRRVNDVEVSNPRGEPFAVGGAYLEVTLEDGRVVRSTPSDFLVAVGDAYSGWDEPTLLRIAPGEPALLRALRFPT